MSVLDERTFWTTVCAIFSGPGKNGTYEDDALAAAAVGAAAAIGAGAGAAAIAAAAAFFATLP